MVQVGDIILVQTPNIFYTQLRKLYGTEFDHAILVVDADRCLHITYPKAKLVPVDSFLKRQRNPVIVRVNQRSLSDENRLQFISNCKHASVGKLYDSTKLMQFFRLSLLEKMGVQASLFGSSVMSKVRKLGGIHPEGRDVTKTGVIVLEAEQNNNQQKRDREELKKKRSKVICSDLIYRELTNFIPELNHAVLQDEKALLGDLDFHYNDFLSPKDFYRIAKAYSPEIFEVESIYTEE